MENGVQIHRRNLPHIYIPNSTYFITFRLKGSIPENKLKEYFHWHNSLKMRSNNNREINNGMSYISKYDEILHEGKLKYLQNPVVMDLVSAQLHKYDSKVFELICFSIMPNHVHVLIKLLEGSKPLSKIMQTIKRVSGYQANKILGMNGSFWQSESFDHIVRSNKEMLKIVNYILNNPVKAELVEDAKKWKGNYYKYF